MPVRRAANPTNSHARSAPVEMALLNVLSRAAKTMMSIPISRSASQKNLAICRLCSGPCTLTPCLNLLQAETSWSCPMLHEFKFGGYKGRTGNDRYPPVAERREI